MPVHFAKWLLILALTFSVGAHWILLQSAAWTTMLAANLTTDSVSAALEKTFDGKHPCELCKSIKSGKKSEQKSEQTCSSHKKHEFLSQVTPAFFSAPSRFMLIARLIEAPASIPATPPVPPPRGCSV